MQSKKFRSQQFYIGDLVAANWRPEKYLGLGVILEIHENRWNERSISVLWQGIGVTKEAAMDLVLIEQVVD